MKHASHAHSIAAALNAFMVFAIGQQVLAQSPAPAHHVRGTLMSVTERALTVQTRGGPVSIEIGEKTKVVGLIATTAAEITSGAFVGIANVTTETSSTARALEVVVFPASMAGTGEGDYPWDLPAGRKQKAAMTNGTVEPDHGPLMMTNGTVMGINNRVAKHITLQYRDGTKAVTIPAEVPVDRIVPGTRALLVAGAHVVVFPAPAGGVSPFVIVGEGETIPAM